MKYNLAEVTRHCLDKPALWTEIIAGAAISPDYQTITTHIRIKGLKALDSWPWWAKALKLLSSRRDSGMGDTIDRWARWTGISFVKTALKIDCKCAQRKTVLNHRFPYLALVISAFCILHSAFSQTPDFPLPPLDYLQTNTVSCDPVATATGYYWILETNGISVPYTLANGFVLDTNRQPVYGATTCATFYTADTNLTLVLPNTNTYSILAVGATDGSDIAWTYKTCNLTLAAAPFTFVTIAGQNPLGTLQTSEDLLNWTNLAIGLQEISITIPIQPGRHPNFRTFAPWPNLLTNWQHY